MSETAVLAMSYGTPAGPEQLEAYYTHIRRGRPPTPELLADFASATRRSVATPRCWSSRARRWRGSNGRWRSGPPRHPVALGMKHANPFIEDTVAELAAGGARRIIGLVLAPHYSRMSVGEYGERARPRAPPRRPDGPRFRLCPHGIWRPAIWTSSRWRSKTLCECCPRRRTSGTRPVHSPQPPQADPRRNDPYPAQLSETAAEVAARTGLERWSVAWQSAGRTPEPWIGPDVLEVMSELAAAGARAVVVCPAGFVTDHLEVLYDLDIEAAARARELGIAFARTASPNTDPRVLDALAGVVIDKLAREAVTA